MTEPERHLAVYKLASKLTTNQPACPLSYALGVSVGRFARLLRALRLRGGRPAPSASSEDACAAQWWSGRTARWSVGGVLGRLATVWLLTVAGCLWLATAAVSCHGRRTAPAATTTPTTSTTTVGSTSATGRRIRGSTRRDLRPPPLPEPGARQRCAHPISVAGGSDRRVPRIAHTLLRNETSMRVIGAAPIA